MKNHIRVDHGFLREKQRQATKITNVLDDLLTYLFLEIMFVLCLCKNHVWYLFGVWNRSVKKVRARDRNK